MDRRSLLQLTAVTAGAGLVAGNAKATRPASQNLRASFIERPDRTALFYKEWGSGKPVIFVHGAGVNSELWSYQMEPLAEAGLRCIAFDRRGHGRSSDPGRGYDYDTLADDLAAVLEALDVRGATLVGHSMGCGEIIRYLTRHGGRRVARIALLAPTLPFFLQTADNPQGIDKAAFQALRAQWARDYPRWVADHSRAFFMPDTSAEMRQWAVGLAVSTSLQAALDCNTALTETDFRKELANIDVPTLIVHGTADASCPIAFTGQRTAALIPGSDLKIYDDAPHGLMITHRERVNTDLWRFIQS